MTENLQKTFGDYLGRTTVSKTYDKNLKETIGMFFLRRPGILKKMDYDLNEYIDFVGIGKAIRWGMKEADNAEQYEEIFDSTGCGLEFDDYDNGRQVYDCLDYDNVSIFFDDLCNEEKLGNDILNDSRFQPVFEDNEFIGLRIAG